MLSVIKLLLVEYPCNIRVPDLMVALVEVAAKSSAAAGAVVPIPTLPAEVMVMRVARAFAVLAVDTAAVAVCKLMLPDPPVPVPVPAAIVRLPPTLSELPAAALVERNVPPAGVAVPSEVPATKDEAVKFVTLSPLKVGLAEVRMSCAVSRVMLPEAVLMETPAKLPADKVDSV